MELKTTLECVICNKTKLDETVIALNEEEFKKFWKTLFVRHKNKKKYNETKLPPSLNCTHGYHAICRRYFKLPDKQLAKISSKEIMQFKKSLGYSTTGNDPDNEDDENNTNNRSSDSTGEDDEDHENFNRRNDESDDFHDSDDDSEDGDQSTDNWGKEDRGYDYMEGTEDEEESHDESTDLNALKICIFCGKNRKFHRKKLLPLYKCDRQSIVNIKTIARQINDSKILNAMKSITTDSTIFNHSHCRVAFINQKVASIRKVRSSPWKLSRMRYKQAFEELSHFIQTEIITNKKQYFLSTLLSIFKDFLLELSNKGCDDNIDFDQPNLEQKIKKRFGKEIKIVTKLKKKIVVSSTGNDVTDENFQLLQEDSILRQSALILRKRILKLTKNPLPNKNLQTDDILKGECSIPDSIYNHYMTVVCGLDKRQRNNSSRATKVNSICQDLIYATTSGKIKPSKQMTLGLTVISKTNCKDVINILNRYGHCCSYTVLKELETELAYAAIARTQLCPVDISLVSHLSAGVAWDFDRFVETGKDTSQDTVGIIYQFEDTQSQAKTASIEASTSHDVDMEIETNETSSNSSKKNERKRAYNSILSEIEEYIKRPKMIDTIVLSSHDNNGEPSLDLFFNVNLLWMMSHASHIDNMPMWVGFNSWFHNDNTLKQKVEYLTLVNESPTSASVIPHTMKESLKIAGELGQQYRQMTTDLAICKIVYRLQSTENGKFDKIFSHPGDFHIDMAFRKATGKFHDGCGLTDMMMESGIISVCSVNGFITGKHYNRCQRLYPLTSLALQILHFESFLKHDQIELSKEVINELEKVINSKDFTILVENGSLCSIMNKYQIYKQKTEAGEHGKTAQFYMTYIRLVDYSLMLSKSIRTSDFHLYQYVLPKITNLFFVMNQPNCARSLVKYSSDLEKIDETHSGLRAEFEKGAFGVKRTDKPFSRQPVDLTLMQTVNANAGRQPTETSHCTNSIGARERWAKSRILISTIISQVNDEIGLVKKEDITADLEHGKIKKHVNCLNKFLDTLRSNINPFDSAINPELLFNISSGKAAEDETANFLLNVEEDGDLKRKDFIKECGENNLRFEERIKRNKILNFSSQNFSKKVKVNGKVQELRMQRDLFGRLLGISIDFNIDIEKLMEYPLTPIPTSMCRLDGTIYKTAKAALTRCLENKLAQYYQSNPHIQVPSAPKFNIVIIDGFYMLQRLVNVPNSFGMISKKFLSFISACNASRIDIIFDRYLVPSIKDVERTARDGFHEPAYIISGPNQTRSGEIKEELKNSTFKEALVKFFIDHWTSDDLVPFFGNKKIYLNHKCCYSYQVISGKIVRKDEIRWECEPHEEADTKIIYHVTQIDVPCNILLKCNDTDILVIMLGNMSKLQCPQNIWMQLGTGNTTRLVDITTLHKVLGGSVCAALPAFHALTGCDYNPSFFNRGKDTPFTILEQSEEYQQAFSSLGEGDIDESSPALEVIEQFVCDMYNRHGDKSVNTARYRTFLMNHKPTAIKEKFKKKLKNLDSSSFPPSQRELYQQILRTNYIASIWKNSYLSNPTALNPDGNGWKLDDNKYEFVWFDGPQLPQLTQDVILQEEDEEDEEISYPDEFNVDSEDE